MGNLWRKTNSITTDQTVLTKYSRKKQGLLVWTPSHLALPHKNQYSTTVYNAQLTKCFPFCQSTSINVIQFAENKQLLGTSSSDPAGLPSTRPQKNPVPKFWICPCKRQICWSYSCITRQLRPADFDPAVWNALFASTARYKEWNYELSQRAPPIFGWAAITLGIGPHSS